MRMRIATAAVALSGLVAIQAVAAAAPAYAHQGDPNFRSTVTAISPPAAGVQAEVANLDDRLVLTSNAGHTVEIEGYEDEPYARLLPDGTVQVNQRSPATYLNNDPIANATVPKSANAKAAPVWKTIEGDNRYETHDHRIHWMARGRCPEGDRPGRPDQGLRLVGPGAGGRREADGHQEDAVVARQGRGGRHAGRRDRRAGRARARVDRVRRDRAPRRARARAPTEAVAAAAWWSPRRRVATGGGSARWRPPPARTRRSREPPGAGRRAGSRRRRWRSPSTSRSRRRSARCACSTPRGTRGGDRCAPTPETRRSRSRSRGARGRPLTVTYRVVSADGHPVSGGLTFQVGETAAAPHERRDAPARTGSRSP